LHTDAAGMVFSIFISEVSLGCLIKIKIGNNLYSEIIPIEPEPGNAGAGNKKPLERVSVFH